MNVQNSIVYKSFTIFLVENFSVNARKIYGNGAFTEKIPTKKLGEISALNAIQELNFSKLVRLQPVTVLEIELYSFFFIAFQQSHRTHILSTSWDYPQIIAFSRSAESYCSLALTTARVSLWQTLSEQNVWNQNCCFLRMDLRALLLWHHSLIVEFGEATVDGYTWLWTHL